VVADATDEGFDGISFLQAAGNIVLMNNGIAVRCAGGEPAPTCTGQPDGPFTPATPTQDPNVRRAVAAALDVEQIYQRAFGGAGTPGSELFPDWFVNHPDVPGPEYDLDEARQLVEQAKADGWDGRIVYATDQAPANLEVAQAVQAMLGSVGMNVEVVSDSSSVFAQRKRDGNFHLANHGFNITDDDMGTARNIASNMLGSSSANRMGYKSAEMDAAIGELFGAEDDTTKQDAYEAIAQQYVADVPFFVLGSVEERPTWSDSVHGIYGTVQSMIYLDKAWIGS
jgi:peptide/nickel transport system substrate-binding protein